MLDFFKNLLGNINYVKYENKNIFLVPNEQFDIIPYYRIADLLVSDISSTMFEYLPLNRPIIQAECYTLRLKHRIFPHRFWKRLDKNALSGSGECLWFYPQSQMINLYYSKAAR